MRFAIAAFIVAMTAAPLAAQVQSGPGNVPQAPVGHRQPRQDDLLSATSRLGDPIAAQQQRRNQEDNRIVGSICSDCGVSPRR